MPRVYSKRCCLSPSWNRSAQDEKQERCTASSLSQAGRGGLGTSAGSSTDSGTCCSSAGGGCTSSVQPARTSSSSVLESAFDEKVASNSCNPDSVSLQELMSRGESMDLGMSTLAFKAWIREAKRSLSSSSSLCLSAAASAAWPHSEIALAQTWPSTWHRAPS